MNQITAIPPITTSATNHNEALEQIERYRLLVESVQDYAIYLIDVDGKVASWNTGAQKLKGYTPEEIIGKHFSVFYQKQDVEAGMPQRELENSLKYGRVEDEGWRVRKNGSRFWANVVLTALFDTGGKHIGYAKVTKDITDRKDHEDKLREANALLRQQRRELRKLNRSKDEFISLASHQLRTPAAGTKQFLGLLLDGYAGSLTPLQQEFLHKAYESNDRQIVLVNDLLRVAQIDAGKIQLVKKDTNIVALVRDVIDGLADAFKGRHQTITFHSDRKRIVVTVDGERFRMVVENIVENASKYTAHGGNITVQIVAHPEGIMLEVTDTGVGIYKKDLPKLFQKFSRINNDLSEIVGGSGLGLYWAHKVTALHEGHITVESQPGRGTSFRVFLPGGAR